MSCYTSVAQPLSADVVPCEYPSFYTSCDDLPQSLFHLSRASTALPSVPAACLSVLQGCVAYCFELVVLEHRKVGAGPGQKPFSKHFFPFFHVVVFYFSPCILCCFRLVVHSQGGVASPAGPAQKQFFPAFHFILVSFFCIFQHGFCIVSGLLCLSTAKEGGLTSWSSSGAIYNRMLGSHPEFVKVSAGSVTPLPVIFLHPSSVSSQGYLCVVLSSHA